MPKPVVIDLSHDDTDVDFAKARAAGVIGVIHQATRGTDFVDPIYAQRKRQASRARLLWGAYHVGASDDVSGQVTNFLNTTQPDGRFLLVLDFAQNGYGTMSLDQAKQFLAAVAAQTNQRPVLHTGAYYDQCTGNRPDSSMAQYRVWWAEYANAPKVNPTWPTYWLWQYSDGTVGPDEKVVAGVASCDCNAYAGDEARLRATWLA
jgi:lysozyme